MILLAGIPSEPPLARLLSELERLGAETVVFDQRRHARAELELEMSGAGVAGTLRLGSSSWPLDAFRSVYNRMMDDRFLPGVDGKPASDPDSVRCRSLHHRLLAWTEVAPAAVRVVNRPRAMSSNSSKPYQLQLIRRHRFRVPETLVTNDPEKVLEFRERWGKLIYKSISGVRSVVQVLRDGDLDRLERVRWCPVQFQQWVAGTDVRVHVVGREVHATAVMSDAVDYRYACRDQESSELRPAYLGPELSERCRALAGGLGLAFAGIDLRLTPEGEAYCFEVNPCPGYSYYEAQTRQPIARALASYLSGKG